MFQGLLIKVLFQGLDDDNKVKYYRALEGVRYEKQSNLSGCPLLTYVDIQDTIDLVNDQCQDDNESAFKFLLQWSIQKIFNI